MTTPPPDDDHPDDDDRDAGPHLKLVTCNGEDIGSAVAAPSDASTTLPDASTTLDEEAEPVAGDAVEVSAQDTETRRLTRILEAVLFASPISLTEQQLAAQLPQGAPVSDLLAGLKADYSGRGINLKKVAGRWTFRTADDLAYLLQREVSEERRLSRAALETLAIIAYHQPVTRAEIEDIRGVSTSSGTLDILLDTGWVRMRGRRRAPGRPVTYGTTDAFLEHFGLESIRDLPGLAELKGSGLLDPTMPSDFEMPEPTDVAALLPDELPLDDDPAEPVGHDADGAGDDGEVSPGDAADQAPGKSGSGDET